MRAPARNPNREGRGWLLDAKQECSVFIWCRQDLYGDRSDEGVSEVIVVVRESVAESQAKFHSMGSQLVPASPESLCKW